MLTFVVYAVLVVAAGVVLAGLAHAVKRKGDSGVDTGLALLDQLGEAELSHVDYLPPGDADVDAAFAAILANSPWRNDVPVQRLILPAPRRPREGPC